MKIQFSIDMSNPMALPLVGYLESLPFAAIEKRDDKTFEEAARECNAVSVDEFFDELDARIERWPDNA